MSVVVPDIAERIRKLEALARRPGTVGEGMAARAALERLRARLGTTQRPATIIGLRLRLDRECDRRHPCCDRHGIVGAGKGPHKFEVRCATCNRHRGWIKAAAGDLLSAMHRDGRLSSAPILRDGGLVP